jgi:hypothetical protein
VNQGNAFRRKKMSPSARSRYLDALRAFPGYPRALAASRERALPRFDAQRLAPQASQPDAAAPRLAAPQPIATLAVTPPAPTLQPVGSALPHPGSVPIDFHPQRIAGAPVGRPERISPRFAIAPPSFLLRAVLERLEAPARSRKPLAQWRTSSNSRSSLHPESRRGAHG